jgi:hypothetical protein
MYVLLVLLLLVLLYVSVAYYRGAMGILLVYDVTDEASFNNIRNWMRNIEQHASDNVNKVQPLPVRPCLCCSMQWRALSVLCGRNDSINICSLATVRRRATAVAAACARPDCLI